ncbi:MAG: acyltransferase family protein [Pseudomonadota bacterium]
MRYRAEIDGLRALAVLPVIVYHAELGVLPGGFAGVDVFFVISGFLITGILLDDLAADRFSVRHFYERRARRILPALSVVMIACFPPALILMDPRNFEAFADSAVAAAFFFANIHFWRTLDYFNNVTATLPLIHTWSLAVEEQFYFLFPPVLWLLWRYGRRMRGDWLLWSLALATVASFALAVVGSTLELRSNFYLLPARAWELLVGSIAALHVHRHGLPVGRWTGPAALFGLILLGLSFQFMDESFGFPGPWTLVPVLGTALVLLCARPSELAGRLLSWRPVVGIGLVSYSAYLWHQPLFAFARAASLERPSTVVMVTLGLLSIALAWASWRYLERPFRNRTFLSQRQLFAAALALILLPAGFGATAMALSDLNRQAFLARLSETAQERWLAWEAVRGRHSVMDEPCRFATTTLDDETRTRIAECVAARGPAILVTGDSHAGDVFNALAQNLRMRTVVLLGGGGCRPGQQYDTCHPEPLIPYLEEAGAAVERVIFTQAGFWLWLTDQDPAAGRVVYARSNGKGTPNAEVIDRTISYVEAVGAVAPTTWLGPRFEPHVDPSRVFARSPGPVAMRSGIIEQITSIDTAIGQRVADWAESPSYVSQLAAVTPPETETFMLEGALLYNDGDHWSPVGEAIFGRRIVETLGLSERAP